MVRKANEFTHPNGDLTPHGLNYVRALAEGDGPSLRSLGESVTRWSAEHPVETIVVDACKGLLVGEFLEEWLATRTGSRPRQVLLAGSRPLTRQAKHARAMQAYLQRLPRLGNTVIATEEVNSGGSLRFLVEQVLPFAEQLCVAVVHPAMGERYIRKKAGLPSEVGVCVSRSGSFDRGFGHELVKRGLGLVCVAGQATPRPMPDALPEVGNVIRNLYRNQAH